MQWPALHFGEPLHIKIYCTVEKRRRLTFLNLSSLGKPLVESCLSQPGVLFGNECAFGHLYAVVSRLWVSDNFSRILECSQASPDKFIEAELFRPSYFYGAIHRGPRRDAAYLTGDIVSGHRLDKCSWQVHLVALGGEIGDALNEFIELRSADDRIGDG